MTPWTTKDIPPQTGRLAVVTGGTGGLGFEIALALACAGAEVVVAGRNSEKGSVAVERIQRAKPDGAVYFELLDLASLASVHAFAGRLNGKGKALDLLVNNAGVAASPTRRVTEDGFELQFGTNHLGHFALTGLLLPLLRRGASSRVVTMSSLGHRGGKINFDDLQGEKEYKPFAAYPQSKLANLLFALELQRRSDAGGWGIMSLAAHPGFARTELMANAGTSGIMAILNDLLAPFASHSAAEGALPALFAATSPDAVPMGYYGPGKMFEMKGPVAPAVIAKQAKDEAVARRLWEVSEKLTGVSFPAV